MMGNDEEELRNRIRKADEESERLQTKLIDTSTFKQRREIVMG